MSDRPVKILLMEDNPGDARLVQEMLAEISEMQCDVECVDTIAKGLVRLAEGSFDLVLQDLSLPDSDWQETLTHIRGQMTDLAVVVLTGSFDEALGVHALRVGAQDYLLKDQLQSRALARTITYAIERKQLEQELRRHRDHLEELVAERTAQLEERNERLLREITEREQAEERIRHLNRVLRAVRGVNQLIIKEKDRDRLIKACCHKLIETRGYGNAWIALLDESGGLATAAESGFGEKFLPMVERLKRGELPECASTALNQADVLVTEDPVATCTDCPLAHRLAGGSGMTVRLQHGAKVYGLLVVSVAAGLTKDEEELSLFEEVAGDIAFALHSIELQEEHKQAEAERARLAAAIEHAAETIIVTDTDGTIQYVNPGFEQITGYAREEVIGQNPRMLKSGKQDQAFYAQLWDTIAGGEVWCGHFINLRKDGALYEEEATISPVYDSSGEIVNYVAVKRDISEQLKIERQLRQAQKLEAIGTLAGGIAHDFNNVLAAIIGYTQLAAGELPADSNVRHDLDRVLSAADRAKDLVRQILTFSRQVEEERQPIKLHLIIREALKLLRPSLPTTIEIKEDIDRDCEPVLADPTQMHQVIMNLCTNAYQAMTEEGGVLAVALKPFAADHDFARSHPNLHEGAYVRLTVSDTGHGMDKETLERIFEPFFTTKERGEGTGLGLATVHGIATAHGGTVTVYSELGTGSTFHVYLPCVERSVPEQTRGETPIRGGHERILVVDDEKDIADMMERALEQFGYDVIAMTSSVDALAAFCAQPHLFDLIITDYTMSKMTGEQLASKVTGIRPDIPIILMTGFSERISRERAEEIGLSRFLMKPADPRHIARVVREVLDKKDNREA